MLRPFATKSGPTSPSLDEKNLEPTEMVGRMLTHLLAQLAAGLRTSVEEGVDQKRLSGTKTVSPGLSTGSR